MSQNPPVVFFVDDEPPNRYVFKASMPKEWEIRLFESGSKALEEFSKLKPAVVISDQIMPGLSGVKFLELCYQIDQMSTRILVTAYSEEDLVIEGIRSAKIFDYIKKPWDTQELINRVRAGIEHHVAIKMKSELEAKLRENEKRLLEKNNEVTKQKLELEKHISELKKMTSELKSWVQPVVMRLLREIDLFPIKRDLALIAFDIVDSSQIHGKMVLNKSLKTLAVEEFSSLVLKHGGYLEAPAGDACYANFGLVESLGHPADAALAVAIEFKAALKGISAHYQFDLNAGIALHFGPSVEATISEFTINSLDGPLIQKRFLTHSLDVDLVHRIEKMAHEISGTNILLTEAFKNSLSRKLTEKSSSLGSFQIKGQPGLSPLFLIPDETAGPAEIDSLKAKAVKN